MLHGMTDRTCFSCESPTLYLVLTVTFHRVLEINTGLICSCTLVFKPFLKHLTSKRRSQDLTLYPKVNVLTGKRSDTGPLRQNTGDMGFLALGNDDIEMKVSCTGTLEVEHVA